MIEGKGRLDLANGRRGLCPQSDCTVLAAGRRKDWLRGLATPRTLSGCGSDWISGHVILKSVATFESWNEYGLFEDAVKTKTRYVLDERCSRFLDAVKQTCEPRRVSAIPSGTEYWRSQIDHAWKDAFEPKWHLEKDSLVIDDGYDVIDQVPTACGKDRMIPWRDRAVEGRVNPKGIPCLYLSEKKETAIGEMRPWIGSLVSVATFRTNKELRVVDCSLDYVPLCYYLEEPASDEREKAVWSAINEAFSAPVERADCTADYAPTQILAETFRKQGYDGIKYKSSLGEGVNLALFEVDHADYIGSALCKISCVKHEFEDAEYHDARSGG
jgi:RES domain